MILRRCPLSDEVGAHLGVRRIAMRTFAACIIAAVAMPATASAQSPQGEMAYCQALASTYVHYIGRSEFSPYNDVRRGSLDGQVAASQCVPGRTAEAISVLEEKLRNGKVTLPPRG
jgi:hypothetical protein